jgi:hypothetical protein
MVFLNFLTLSGLEMITRSGLASRLACFFPHLPGVSGFGLLHYGDGVTGRTRALNGSFGGLNERLCKIGGSLGIEGQ